MSDPAELTEDASEKESTRLPESQWAEIVVLWEIGDVTLPELSKKYGISIAGLSKGLKKRGAVKGKRKAELAAEIAKSVVGSTVASAAEEVVDAVAERKKKVEETRSEHYQWSTMIAKLTMAELAKAQKSGVPFGNVINNLKALRQAGAIIATAREQRYAILGMDGEVDEKGLPTLEIRDLQEEELEALRSMDHEDDGLDASESEPEEVVSEE